VKNFVVSTDSCVDYFKSHLENACVYCITLTRVLEGKEITKHYNSSKEFDVFYNSLKKGALPSTVALNPYELQEHFEDILKKEKTGDIIHVCISSGLSMSCENAQKVAEELNATLSDRRIYVVDSLIATLGMNQMVDELIRMRDSGEKTSAAIKRIEELRGQQQGWIIMSDLFHLRRGGRISGVRATIGTVLNIKPIIVITKKGRLVLENKMRGNGNAIDYVIGKMKTLGEEVSTDFDKQTFYIARTSESSLYEELKLAVTQKYPKAKIQESIVSPVIGTHLGCGAALVLFEGARRLNINDKPRGA